MVIQRERVTERATSARGANSTRGGFGSGAVHHLWRRFDGYQLGGRFGFLGGETVRGRHRGLYRDEPITALFRRIHFPSQYRRILPQADTFGSGAGAVSALFALAETLSLGGASSGVEVCGGALPRTHDPAHSPRFVHDLIETVRADHLLHAVAPLFEDDLFELPLGQLASAAFAGTLSLHGAD